ncbi:hypothetical protein PFISCL1PPCAC_334 [Pristionchus fissidentatus]|uniref:Uncharacterized protein n=1 Tax=Pristionchus fissidentatus TaxID=1538716 RepID=A0AAV5UPM1_9BILA|nr:hypothetical protein PFISCL1PPCAC_334 [Pristionchus fissidentatus]
MVDGDKAEPSTQRNLKLNARNLDAKQTSYFFGHQVECCQIEQHKVLGSLLTEKEREAQITYDKMLADLFAADAQIDNAFTQLVFDSNARVNLDQLVSDMRVLADSKVDADISRLLDFLFVTKRASEVLEEQQIRGVSYDLYDGSEKFGSMTSLSNVLSESQGTENKFHTVHFALMLSLIASGKEDMIRAGLFDMAKTFRFSWDAVILSRYFFGSEDECTKKLHAIWLDSIDKDGRFPILKLTCAFNEHSLVEVADALLNGTSKKPLHEIDMVQAYRCLAITLATASPTVPDLTRNLMVSETSSKMRAIFVTLLGWGKLRFARSMVNDISKRVPPSEVDSDICQICINCYVDLVEQLLNSQSLLEENKRVSEPPAEGVFTYMANKWRREISNGQNGMEKLKTEKPVAQKVVFAWVRAVVLSIRQTFEDEPNVANKKMECAFIAVEFLLDMIRWACQTEGDKLRLSLVGHQLSIFIKDDALIMLENVVTSGRQSRAHSTASIKSATASSATTTSMEESRSANQQPQGQKKEDRPLKAPVQDVRRQVVQQQERPQVGFGTGNQNRDRVQMQQQFQSGTQQTQLYNQAKSNQDSNWRGQDNRRSGGTPGTFNGSTTDFSSGDGTTVASPHSSINNAASAASHGSPVHNPMQQQSSVAQTLHLQPVSALSLLPLPSSPSVSQQRPVAPPRSLSDIEGQIDKYLASDDSSSYSVTYPPVTSMNSPRISSSGISPHDVLTPSKQKTEQQQQPDIGGGVWTTEDVMTQPQSLPRTPRGGVKYDISQEKVRATFEESLGAKLTPASPNDTHSQQQATLPQPPTTSADPTVVVNSNVPVSSTSAYRSRPTMGVPAATEARARRNFSPEQILQQLHERKTSEPERHFEKTEEMLDANLKEIVKKMEETVQELPTTDVVAAASSSPLGSTQLTHPTHTTVLPPTTMESYEGDGRASCSSSAISMLTPITEASQETFGSKSTALSESDTPQGLANVSTDSVFVEMSENTLNFVARIGEEQQRMEEVTVAIEEPLQVDVEERTISPRSAMVLMMTATPTTADVTFASSSGAPTPMVPSPVAVAIPVMNDDVAATSAEKKPTQCFSDSAPVTATVIEDEKKEETTRPLTPEDWDAALKKIDEEKAQKKAALVQQPEPEQQQQRLQEVPKADAHYEELMNNNAMNISPDPNEVNRLFQGRGGDSLPKQLEDEMAKEAAEAAAAAEKCSSVTAPMADSLALVEAHFSMQEQEPDQSVSSVHVEVVEEAVEMEKEHKSERVEQLCPSVDDRSATPFMHTPPLAQSTPEQPAGEMEVTPTASVPMEQPLQLHVEIGADTGTRRPVAPDATEQSISAATLEADQELDTEILVRGEGGDNTDSGHITTVGTATAMSKSEHLTEICEEIHERVTVCGVSYRYSPPQTVVESSSACPAKSEETISEDNGEKTNQSGGAMFLSEMLDFALSSVEPLEENEREKKEEQQSSYASASFSVSTHSDAGTAVTHEDIDEHAAQRRIEASERGDAGSEMGNSALNPFPYAASEQTNIVYSIPSSAMTTPDPHLIEGQFTFASDAVQLQNAHFDTPTNNTAPEPTQSGTSIGSSGHSSQLTQVLYSINQGITKTMVPVPTPVYHDPFVLSQPQQPTFQQMHEPLQATNLQPDRIQEVSVCKEPLEAQKTQQLQHSGEGGGDGLSSDYTATDGGLGGDDWAIDGSSTVDYGWGNPTPSQPQQRTQQSGGRTFHNSAQNRGFNQDSHNNQTPHFGTGGGQSQGFANQVQNQSHGFSGNQNDNKPPNFGTGGNQGQGIRNQNQSQGQNDGAPSFGTYGGGGGQNSQQSGSNFGGMSRGRGGRGGAGGPGYSGHGGQRSDRRGGGVGGGPRNGYGDGGNQKYAGGDCNLQQNKNFNTSSSGQQQHGYGGQDVRRGGGGGAGRGRGGSARGYALNPIDG